MLRRTSFWMAAALSLGLLTACDTNKGSTQSALEPSVSSLVFASPAPGQEGVALRSPIFLRFSDPIASSFDVSTVQLVNTRTNTPVAVAASRPLANTSGNIDLIRLDPAAPLSPNTTYVVRVNGAEGVLLNTPDGERVAALQTLDGTPIRFTTRAALRGSAEEMSRSVGFTVTQVTIPSLGLNNQASDPITRDYPLTDFSTIRMELSQPIESSTAIYGSTVRLVDNQNNTVDARLFVKGPRLTIDPKQDLSPGVNYRIVLTDGLRSELARPLTGALSFPLGMPLDSRASATGDRPRQRALVTVPTCPNEPCLSSLSGEPVNKQAVQADILGFGLNAPAPALNAERSRLLGDVGNPVALSLMLQGANSESIPLRVFAGNTLVLNPLPVRLLNANNGLQTPLRGAGARGTTGDLTITLLSDATGLVTPSAYSSAAGAPAMVKLFLDVAVSAQNPDADGAFTQNILHAEANGIARLNTTTGRLEVETVGTLELKILDTDDAFTILSLKLDSDLNAVDLANNTTFQPNIAPLDITSWVPGNISDERFAGLRRVGIREAGDLIRPGDPLIVNFSQPIDPQVARERIRLLGPTGEVPATIKTDGSSVIISPTLINPAETVLQYGATYRIVIAGLTGLNGTTPLSRTLTFTLPNLVEEPAARPDTIPAVRGPVVLRSYPGFPCNLVDQVNNRRCVGGITQAGTDTAGNVLPLDDVISPAFIDPRRDIELVFSQDVNVESLRRHFSVRDVTANVAVPGVMTSDGRVLRFKPSRPWELGKTYAWRLNSAPSGTLANSVVGTNGQPLQTQLIAQTLAAAQANVRGGDPLEVQFGVRLITDRSIDPRFDPLVNVVTDPKNNGGTLTALRGFPTADVNANFLYEPTIPGVRPFGERLAANENPATGEFCTAQPLSATLRQLTDPMVDDGDGDVRRSLGRRCLLPNGALLQAGVARDAPPNIQAQTTKGGAAAYFAVGCSEGTMADYGQPVDPTDPAFACQANQFLHISSALAGRIVGLSTLDNFPTLFPADRRTGIVGNQVAVIEIDPGFVVFTGTDLYAALGLGELDGTLVNVPLPGTEGIEAIVDGLISFLGTLAGATPLQQVVTGLVNGLVRVVLPVAPLNTGPLVLRLRRPLNKVNGVPTLDANGSYRSGPIVGVIYQSLDDSGNLTLKLRTQLEVYVDIPEINAAADLASLGVAPIPIEHNFRSNANISEELPTATAAGQPLEAGFGCRLGHMCRPGVLEGEVNFLSDGRLTVALANRFADVPLRADLGGLGLPGGEGLLTGYLNIVTPIDRFGVDVSLPPIKTVDPLLRAETDSGPAPSLLQRVLNAIGLF